jgi:hypothetical protein
MLAKLTALLLLPAALTLNSCGSHPAGEPPAAVVAGDTIPRREMKLMLERFQGDSARVQAAVENIINSRLVLADAESRGLNDTPDMQRYRYEREREQLQNAWMTWYLNLMVTIDPDTVREFYSQLGTQVIYTIMNVQDSSLCDSLRNLTLAGQDLAPLVVQFSSIPWDVHIQGLVGPVDFMRTSDSDRRLLSGLEQGGVSPMELFPSGWRFLKVDSMYQDSVESFEVLEGFITEYIRSHEMETYKRFMEDSLREANHLTVCQGIPEMVVLHAMDDAGNYQPYTPVEESMPAYTFDGGSRSLISLVENIRNLPPAMPKSPTDLEWVEGYCSILGLYDIMAMEGREQGMDTLPEVMSFVEQSCTSHLLDGYYALVIAPRLTPTAGELRELYEQNEGMFIIPESRTFEAISAFGAGQMDLLESLISSGTDPFSRIADLTLLEGLTAPGDSIMTPSLTLAEVPSPWDSLLFSAELGETLLCTLSTDRVAVFRVAEISPERTASFEEAQEQLVQLVTGEKEEEVVQVLVDSLRNAYHYEVDLDFIRGFFQESLPEVDAGEPESVPADSQTSG